MNLERPRHNWWVLVAVIVALWFWAARAHGAGAGDLAPEWMCTDEAEMASFSVELRDRGVPAKRAEQSLAELEESFARINALPPLSASCVAQQIEITYSAPGRRCSAAMPRLAWYECRARRRPFYPWETGRARGPFVPPVTGSVMMPFVCWENGGRWHSWPTAPAR